MSEMETKFKARQRESAKYRTQLRAVERERDALIVERDQLLERVELGQEARTILGKERAARKAAQREANQLREYKRKYYAMRDRAELWEFRASSKSAKRQPNIKSNA